MRSSILIVDDEPDITKLIAYNLEQAGHNTQTAPDGATALESVESAPPDLIILDLMLPDLSGTEVCRRLKAEPATAWIPIIIVTARDTEFDRVVGFELGADDYVPKPFSIRELVLRSEAVLRRATADNTAPTEELGSITLNLNAHRAYVCGEEVSLTLAEFDLLRTLISGRGKVFTRDALLTAVWGLDTNILDRTVDAHVMRLRKKLEGAAAHIETVRGVGYRAVS